MQEAYYRRHVCYCCEKPFEKPHSFYKEMCKKCGNFNYQKRMQRVDLSGYRALVPAVELKSVLKRRVYCWKWGLMLQLHRVFRMIR